MNSRIIQTAFFAIIGLLVLATSGALIKSQVVDSPDYIDCPFVRFDESLPRFLIVEEEPLESDQDAYSDFWDRRTEINEYYSTNGAISKATENEKEAFLADENGEYAKAQKLCNAILTKNPDSIPALFALSGARAFGETDLTYALYLIRKARKLAQRQGLKNPIDRVACEWYIRALDRECWILSDLDRNEEKLRTLELISEAYQPFPWNEIWPLVKLERFHEAQQKIDWCLENNQFVHQATNGLIALHDRKRERVETYNTSKVSVDKDSQSPVIWSNAGLAAANVFKLDEAELFYNKSVELGEPDFYGSAYVYLAQIYVQQGRFPEACDAMKRAQQHRSRRELHSLQQDEARTQVAFAQLTLGLGRHDLAEKHARKAAGDVDRAGSTSMHQSSLNSSNHIVLWTVLNFSRERLREKMATSKRVTWADRVKLHKLNLELWLLPHDLRKETRSDQLLIHALREYPSSGPGMESGVATWFRASVSQMLPIGIAQAALEEAREIETHELATPYFDAIEAEIALRAGQNERAQELADSALANLQTGEKLLRARVGAIAGEAHIRLGDLPAAFQHFETTLRDFPQAFRLLQIQLPISIKHDESREAKELAKLLYRSPRFFQHPQGYEIVLAKRPDGISFEFKLTDSSIHIADLVRSPSEPVETNATETSQPNEVKSDSQEEQIDIVALAAMELHDQLMLPVVDMSQIDLSSLDGSPTAIRDREEVDTLLESALGWE